MVVDGGLYEVMLRHGMAYRKDRNETCILGRGASLLVRERMCSGWFLGMP